MKFSEMSIVDASQQKYQFFCFAKKHSKLIKNEENRPNLNCLIKFSEIWYVDAFQHKKIQQENNFLILAFLGFFVGQITAKIVKKN